MKNHSGSIALVVASFSFFSIVLVRFAIPSLLPYIIAVDGVTESMGGLLVSIFWVGYTAFQLIGGLVTDRYGFKALAYVLTLTFALTLTYPLLLRHYYYLAVLQFTVGSLTAMAYVLLVSMVITNYSRSGLGVGIYQSMFFLASSVSIILTPLLIVNYYEPFITYSMVILISLVIFTAVLRHGLIKAGTRTPGGTLRIGPEGLGFLGIGLIRFSSGFAYLGFLSWSTYYVVRVLRAQFATSGFYAFATSILGVAGAIIGGYVGDRFGYVIPSALSSGLLAIAVALLSVVNTPYVILALMLMLGFFYGFYASPTMATTKFARNVGSTSGFLNFMSQLGGTISPYIIGLITQLTNINAALLTTGLISLITVIVGLILARIYGFTK